jgi:hypothetical protein
MYLPGYTTSQVTAQRYVCMRSLAHARRALAIHAVVIILACLLFFVVGATVFAYYQQSGDMPNLPKDKQDQILPLFVTTVLRQAGIIGVLVAGLFAAAMSTIDSGINSLTAVVVYDWLSGRGLRLVYSRLLCGVFGVMVIGAALVVPYLAPNVIGMITTIASTFLGLLLGVYLLGMFVPRASASGAFVGLVGLRGPCCRHGRPGRGDPLDGRPVLVVRGIYMLPHVPHRLAGKLRVPPAAAGKNAGSRLSVLLRRRGAGVAGRMTSVSRACAACEA